MQARFCVVNVWDFSAIKPLITYRIISTYGNSYANYVIFISMRSNSGMLQINRTPNTKDAALTIKPKSYGTCRRNEKELE